MSKIRIHAVVLLCLCLLWQGAMWRIPPSAEDARVVESFSGIPLKIGPWTCENSHVEREPKYLSTASTLDRRYKNSEGDIVSLTILYCTSLGDLHQPEICLGGGGWSAADKSEPTLRPPMTKPFKARLSWIQNASQGDESAVIYWFNSEQVKDTLLPWFKIKVYLCRLGGTEVEGVALVRITAPRVSATGGLDRSKTAAVDFASCISPSIDALMARPPKTVAQVPSRS